MTPIGVTVISPAYRKIGMEAVRRFKKFTGLKVQVIHCRDADGFRAKLSLDRKVGRCPVVYFDADLWMLRPWDVAPLTGAAAWFACHDSAVWNPGSFCHKDCMENGLDRFRYVNSGLFICDLRRAEHRGVFQLARRSYASKRVKRHDTTDQFHLNRALQRLQVPLSFLPARYAFYSLAAVWGQVPAIPREIVGIHAAGVALRHKWNTLRAEAAVFGRPVQPMCRDAVEWAFARMHDLP